MGTKSRILIASICLLAATSAQASVIKINNIVANWSDAVLTNGAAATVSSIGHEPGETKVVWGAGSAQSNYTFYSPASGQFNTEQAFIIGKFTQANKFVSGNDLDKAYLNFNVNLSVDGAASESKTFSYLFDRTTGASGSALVEIFNQPSPNFFTLGGNAYTLVLNGVSGYNTPASTSVSIGSQQSKGYYLSASFTQLPTSVPEPSSWILMLFGLSVVVLRKRSLRKIK
ncbi:MAG: hypothetical protein RL497_2609 [Pseudomonadota bacterium]|jgi:hypothetical protein